MEADALAAQETRKRGRGNPNMKPGVPSVNPTGKPKPVDQVELDRLRERAEQAEAELADARSRLEDQGVKGELKALRARVVEQDEQIARLEAEAAAQLVPDLGAQAARETIMRVLRDGS